MVSRSALRLLPEQERPICADQLATEGLFLNSVAEIRGSTALRSALNRTMQEDEFIAAVQRRTQVESRETAYAVTNATLTVLGQRITGGEAENIASQLPERLDNQLTSEKGQAEEFSVEKFVERVSEHFQETGEGTGSTSNVEHHVRGVLSVLGNAVSGSELDDARNQLPSEFESLFEPIDMSEQQA